MKTVLSISGAGLIIGLIALIVAIVMINNYSKVEFLKNNLERNSGISFSETIEDPDRELVSWAGKLLATGALHFSAEGVTKEQFRDLNEYMQSSRIMVGFCENTIFEIGMENICYYEKYNIGCDIEYNLKEGDNLDVEFACYDMTSK